MPKKRGRGRPKSGQTIKKSTKNDQLSVVVCESSEQPSPLSDNSAGCSISINDADSPLIQDITEDSTDVTIAESSAGKQSTRGRKRKRLTEAEKLYVPNRVIDWNQVSAIFVMVQYFSGNNGARKKIW